MFSRIIVGVDGEAGGRDAIALARALADPATELVLVTVWERFDGIVAAALGRTPPAQAGYELLEQSRRELGLSCRTRTWQAESIAAGLHCAAEDEAADLLVVGSCARQRAGRALLGDHARASLHGAPCAVAVAPKGFARAPRLRRIGVGYQDTPEGDDAVHVARRIATEQGGQIQAITVLPIVPTPRAGSYAYLEAIDDLTGERERTARQRLDALGDVAGKIRWGVPIEELLRASEKLDLLVLGSRGYGPVRRLLLSSTADGVARDAACAVLVVPHGVRAAAEPSGARAGAEA